LNMQPLKELRPLEQVSATFYIETYGCQMNVYDSNAIRGLLVRSGYREVGDPQAADVVLLNTCSVRDHAEHKVISRVGELRRQREVADLPPAVLGICGCMAERLGEDLLGRRHRVDLVVGVDRYGDLPRLVAAQLSGEADRSEAAAVLVGHSDHVHYVAPPEAYPANNSHLVTIHKGCDYRCTYCIVPATRGPQREKPVAAILDEVHGVVAAGGREVTLLGQNVTAYPDFAGLLREVARIDGLERIRFLTGHPCDMHRELMDTIAVEPKVCPWLHVPAQSGSDRVLKRMKRYYRRDDYLAMVDYARRHIPDVTFSGDVIVGFPGETAADFAATLDLVRQVRYDTLFCFKYSVRPGTPSARLPDDVAVEEKKRRLAELMAVQDQVWHALAGEQIGAVWEAVVEEPARRPEGTWRLRTPNNRKIIVPLTATVPGQRLRIRVTGHRNTSFLGETV